MQAQAIYYKNRTHSTYIYNKQLIHVLLIGLLLQNSKENTKLLLINTQTVHVRYYDIYLIKSLYINNTYRLLYTCMLKQLSVIGYWRRHRPVCSEQWRMSCYSRLHQQQRSCRVLLQCRIHRRWIQLHRLVKPVPELDMGPFSRPNPIYNQHIKQHKQHVLNQTRKLCDANYSNADF